jgi:hypothetical protein
MRSKIGAVIALTGVLAMAAPLAAMAHGFDGGANTGWVMRHPGRWHWGGKYARNWDRRGGMARDLDHDAWRDHHRWNGRGGPAYWDNEGHEGDWGGPGWYGGDDDRGGWGRGWFGRGGDDDDD